jgi:hypothetical protein
VERSKKYVRSALPYNERKKTVFIYAASNPNPRLRYLAGKDVESWAAGKKNMDELEFFNMIKGLTA